MTTQTTIETTTEDNVIEECIYCGSDVLSMGVPEHSASCECQACSERKVPAVDDDAAWAALAEEHRGGNCEWIVTRAHRRPHPLDIRD